MDRRRSQSGQVMVLVALSLIALIGSAALILLAGSAEWQKNQLQQVADQAALDAALQIGIGCDSGKATTVITAADNSVAAQRTRVGALSIAGGTCATPYTGTDTFAGGLSEIINYPYRAHQQQVEVILTLTLPISFGGAVGKTSTTVVRRAVAQALPESVPAVSAATLTCNSGQVNIGGSVLVHDLIARNGTCALYAHARVDASGTYSDLGNVSVYTDGPWNAPGTCNAGLNTGSLSAICSDGFELSGHATLACGTVAQSYLLAADRTINPNPCAAGTAPQPVAPLNTTLPPEPNADPAIYAKLPGGVPCNPAASYANIKVGGVIVASGLGAAPLPDASGYYHFKPGCYGFLDAGPLSAGISNVQVGLESPVATKTVTPKLKVPSLAGTLLVADLRSETNPSDKPFTAPPNWVFANGGDQDGAAHTEIWYLPGNLNPGGISSVDFGVTPGSVNAVAQLSEWRNVDAVSPLDKSGMMLVGANSLTAMVSTSSATTAANELVITDDGFAPKAGQVVAQGAGWTGLVNDTTNGFRAEYRLDLGAGVASETVASTVATTWSLVIAAFKPAGVGAGAVLDPGFYYFNGSGGAGGGGGVCLNGGTLLARDTTLEFVNAAGFSSGDCTPGGGTACTGACQFGSTPCSISACPPNAPIDSPSNHSWFSAPCNQAPVGDANCPASTWCTVGERSCWNVLIWAAPAPSGTGQFAIKGTVVSHWMLGSIYWPGTCTDSVNGTSTIEGTVSCGTLSISAGGSAATAIGGDYGISTSLVEAILVE